MQSAYSTFVGKLEESARIHLRRQLEASTSSFTLHSLMHRMEQEGGVLADTSLYNNTMDLGGDSPADAANEDDDDDDDDEENGDPGESCSCVSTLRKYPFRCLCFFPVLCCVKLTAHPQLYAGIASCPVLFTFLTEHAFWLRHTDSFIPLPAQGLHCVIDFHYGVYGKYV